VRVVLITQIPPAAHGLDGLLRDLGHEPVAMLSARVSDARYGGDAAGHLLGAPAALDVLIPATRERIAPLLRALEPDVALCAGFPWKIPAEALAAPRLGIVNFHPSLLPRYRGPIPVGWAIRNGETEIGITIHRMDAELDTGAILGQARVTLADEHSFPELEPKLLGAVAELLPVALERLERGEGDPQTLDGASYFSFFEPEYAWIDWGRPAGEIHRQVRAWRFASSGGGEHGALTKLDGERLRVLRVGLEPGAGRPVECCDGTLWILETEPA
jgi:methionyl-tRNA formyltransferase